MTTIPIVAGYHVYQCPNLKAWVRVYENGEEDSADKAKVPQSCSRGYSVPVKEGEAKVTSLATARYIVETVMEREGTIPQLLEAIQYLGRQGSVQDLRRLEPLLFAKSPEIKVEARNNYARILALFPGNIFVESFKTAPPEKQLAILQALKFQKSHPLKEAIVKIALSSRDPQVKQAAAAFK